MGLPPGFNPPPPEPSPIGGGTDTFGIELQIQALFSTIGVISKFLTLLIIAVARGLLFILRAVSKFLLHIWQQYVKKAITWLASHVRKLRAWLKRTIGPIIARLEKIKKWYDTHILKQQLRTLQIIQSIRRFLGILRLFHVAWAAKLDQALSDVQLRIEQDIALIRGTLNQLINTLALTLDPTLLLRSNVLGASLLGNLAGVKRIFGFGDNRLLDPSEQATIAHDNALYYKSTANAHVSNLLATGPTPDDIELRNEFRQALAETTNSTLPTRGA
jgi:hypothetical protein